MTEDGGLNASLNEMTREIEAVEEMFEQDTGADDATLTKISDDVKEVTLTFYTGDDDE